MLQKISEPTARSIQQQKLPSTRTKTTAKPHTVTVSESPKQDEYIAPTRKANQLDKAVKNSKSAFTKPTENAENAYRYYPLNKEKV